MKEARKEISLFTSCACVSNELQSPISTHCHFIQLTPECLFLLTPAYEEYTLTTFSATHLISSLRFMIVSDALHLHILQPNQWVSGSVLSSSSPVPAQFFFPFNSLNAPSVFSYIPNWIPIIMSEGHGSHFFVKFKLLVKQNKVLLMCTV